MDIRVIHPADLTPADIEGWLLLLETNEGLDHPFLSPHFAVAVGRQREAARVAIASDSGEPLGFFAFEKKGRAARPIGSGLSDFQALVLDGNRSVEAVDILTGSNIRVWEFDHLTASQRNLLAHTCHAVRETDSPVVDVRQGFDAYADEIRKRSKSLLQNTARKRRRLEKERGSVVFELETRDHELLDLLLSWKSDQYRRTGRRDRFADPGNRRLMHDLLDISTPAFSGGLAVMWAGTWPVAGLFYLKSATILSYWFPAYDPSFGVHSPGSVFLVDLIRDLGDRGGLILDLGKGSEDYKARFMSWSYPLLEGYAATDPLAAIKRNIARKPREVVVDLVLRSDTLRQHARRALALVGTARQAVHRSIRRD